MQEKIPFPETETGFILVRRKDFSKYITDELLSLIEMWHRIKAYGWPQGKGYLTEPETVRVIVELFDTAKANFLAWEKNNGSGTDGRT